MPPDPNESLQHQTIHENQPHFTVFIRLPFPRGDFVDPPPVEWNSAKDRSLWDILSRVSNGREVDWQALAEKFDVTLPFLLQQAAWLYEQQLSQVKAQLRKATRPASIGTSPTLGSASGSGIAGGHAMTRGGSGGSRVPSALSNRQKDRPGSRGDDGSAEKGNRTRVSRTSSTNTIHQTPSTTPTITQQAPARRQPNLTSQLRNRGEGSRKSLDSPTRKLQPSERPPSRLDEADHSSSSSSSSSDTAAPLSRSRAYVRKPRYSNPKPRLGPVSDADEDAEDSPPFLPFSDNSNYPSTKPSDPSATVRIDPHIPSSYRPVPDPSPRPKAPTPTPTTHSSSSSAQSQSQSQPPSRNARAAQPPLSSLSPRQRRITRESSEGTPSMGSSFSDLDDASVTQSALEEALANEMNHGGVASRMSSISQALRSRYL